MRNVTNDVFLSGMETGPVVSYYHPRKHVTIEFDNPPDDYTQHRKIVPLITEWDELDGVCYKLGKSIMSHFLNKEL